MRGLATRAPDAIRPHDGVTRMQCPICRKEVAISGPFAPFCSERCKLIDLGNWASGKYVIPGEPLPLEDPDEPERP